MSTVARARAGGVRSRHDFALVTLNQLAGVYTFVRGQLG